MINSKSSHILFSQHFWNCKQIVKTFFMTNFLFTHHSRLLDRSFWDTVFIVNHELWISSFSVNFFLSTDRKMKKFFLRCRRFTHRNRLRDRPPFWYCAAGSLGYLRPRHGRRDLISSAACSSRANFCAQNMRVCNRLRNRRRRVLLLDFPIFARTRARTHADLFFFLPSDRPSQWAICGNIARRYTESLPNRCRKTHGDARFEVDRRDLHLGA